MRTHKEGTGTIVVVSSLVVLLEIALLLLVGPVTAIIAAVALLAVLVIVVRFFRYPERTAKGEKGVVYSPCDGRIVVIEKVFEPEHIKAECLQISVFMSVWNVHVNYYPIAGQVDYVKYHKGKFLVAWHPKSSTENERSTVSIKSPAGALVLMRQIAGAVARRIITRSKEGDPATAGGEMGFIKFGSRIDVFVPLETEVLVKVGDVVTGTQSVLAKLPEAKA